jgi:YVTN family beta-propeller protein
MQTLFPTRGLAPLKLWPLVAALCALLLPTSVWATPFAYIPSHSTNQLLVVDAATNTTTTTIAVGAQPYAVAVNAAGTRVYVTNQGSNTLSVIDTSNNTVVATVPVGTQPMGVALNPAGTRAYVTNTSSHDIKVVDTSSNTVIATITPPGGFTQFGVVVNPAGTRLYVTETNNNAVSVIDTATNTVTATVGVGSSPVGIAINPAGTRAYVVDSDPASYNVAVIDTATNTVTAYINVGALPVGVAVSPDGNRVYVTNSSGNSVSVIDATSNTVLTTVAVGNSPRGLSVHPSGASVYVVNQNSNSVSVIATATNTVTATFPAGTSPIGLGNFFGPLPATAAAPTDPIPLLSGLPTVTGIGTQPTVLDLASGQGPAMTDCLLETVRALLGADATYLGQTANGVARVALGGGRALAFYPVQASTNANLGNDIHLGGSNVLNVGSRCGNFNVTPALYSLTDFGTALANLGLSANITSQGVMTLLVGDTVYVARPDYLATVGTATTAGTPTLVRGGDGLYRLTDSRGGVQVLRPAFLDTDALAAQSPQALNLVGTTTIQTDGTALFRALAGQTYSLVPDLTLTPATADNAGLLWWSAGPNRYLFRGNTLVQGQGFTAVAR